MLKKMIGFSMKSMVKGDNPLTVLEFEQELYECFDLFIDYAIETEDSKLLDYAARSLQARILRYKLIREQYIKEVQQIRHPKIIKLILPATSSTPNPDDPDGDHAA